MQGEQMLNVKAVHDVTKSVKRKTHLVIKYGFRDAPTLLSCINNYMKVITKIVYFNEYFLISFYYILVGS